MLTLTRLASSSTWAGGDAWKTERRAREGRWVSGAVSGDTGRAAKNPANASVMRNITPVMGVVNDANASKRFGIRLPSGGAALLNQATPEKCHADRAAARQLRHEDDGRRDGGR